MKDIVKIVKMVQVAKMVKIAKWVTTALLVLIIVLGYSFLKESERAEKGEVYRKQLIAVCGIVDEAITEVGVRGYDFSIHPHHKGYSRKGTVVIVHVREEIIFELYDDGIVKIRRIDGQKEEITEKTWKDYPEFASIGKK